ncbi:MAG: hypothetical protein JW718_00750 [Desulfovibrionaceae bacterium]|nr:hypothetical protein [Desulfovibrionaceae bacterium]
MSFRLWQILCFMLAVVGATVLIFPYEREMVDIYVQGGDLHRAQAQLEEILAHKSPGFELLVTAAGLYQLAGEPDRSIEFLGRALEKKPNNLKALNLMAGYLEWNVQPLRAAPFYERILKITPNRPDLLRKLAGLYLYYGRPGPEGLAMARLVELRRASRTVRGGFMGALQEALAPLAGERLAQGPSPYRDYLMQRLFILGEQFADDEREKNNPDPRQYAVWALEVFLEVDRIPEAKAFAAAMDKASGRAPEHRVLLSLVMRWAMRHDLALEYLAELEKSWPDDLGLLEAEAQAGMESNRFPEAQRALERLTRLRPEERKYRSDLAEVYIQNKDFGKGLALLRELYAKASDSLEYIKRLMAAALASGDKKILSLAAEESEKTAVQDPEVLRARARVYLGMDNPAKAYDLLLGLVLGGDDNPLDLDLLVQAAAASGDQGRVTRAMGLALARRPDDKGLLRIAARAYIETDRPALACPLLRKLALADRSRRDARAMLEAAGYSGDKTLISEAAKTAAEIFQKDPEIMDLAGEIHLWVEAPRRALPYLEKAALLSGGRRDRVLKMLKAASFSGDERLSTEAALLAHRLRPGDPDIALAAAGALYAAGRGDQGAMIMSRLVRAHGDSRDLLLKWAVLSEDAGRINEAFGIYRGLQKRFPEDKTLRRALIRLAGYEARARDAALKLAALSDAAPRDFELAIKAGDAFGAADEPARAIAFFERALGLEPKDAGLEKKLALFYGYVGQYAKMIPIFERIEARSGLSAEDKLALAEAYAAQKQDAKALALLEPLLKDDPPPKREGLILAGLLNRLARRSEARALIPGLAAQYGSDQGYLEGLGAEAFFGDHADLAQDLFARVLQKDPESRTALKGMALAAAAAKDNQRAIRYFKLYNKKYPNDADARYRLAELFTAQDRTGEALGQYRKTLNLLRNKVMKP